MCATAPSSAAIISSAPERSVSTSCAVRSAARAKPPLRCAEATRHAPEREVAEAGIKLRLRMAREEAPPHARLVGALLLDARERAEHGQARMRQRIALAGLGEQHRGAAIGFEVRRVGREPRGQDHRRAVHVGRDRHQRGERVAGIAVERAERAGPGRPQQGLGERPRVEIGRRPAHLRAGGPASRRAAARRLRHSSLQIVHQTRAKSFICHDFSHLCHNCASSRGLVWNRGRAGFRAADSC